MSNVNGFQVYMPPPPVHPEISKQEKLLQLPPLLQSIPTASKSRPARPIEARQRRERLSGREEKSVAPCAEPEAQREEKVETPAVAVAGEAQQQVEEEVAAAEEATAEAAAEEAAEEAEDLVEEAVEAVEEVEVRPERSKRCGRGRWRPVERPKMGKAGPRNTAPRRGKMSQRSGGDT